MSARVPQSGGRPWVAVHTWMLNDPDVLLAGNAARALWLSLLLWSARAGTAGVVPSNPRRVATFARLDGGVRGRRRAGGPQRLDDTVGVDLRREVQVRARSRQAFRRSAQGLRAVRCRASGPGRRARAAGD